MGLASALSTALTGLTAAETTIDVVGNNVANSNTVGFKASEAVFATQFLQTASLGSGPTAGSGGNNPRQIGLGTKVAEISSDFSQGTIEISANPSDLAIQGDGFFMVQGGQGETLYTRNGLFKTNAQNELVTTTGQRLLGFGIDDNFVIQTTQLSSLEIPLGASAVAQATQNVFLEGTFTPTGDVANVAEIIQSQVLSDGSIEVPPNLAGGDINAVAPPDATATTAGFGAGAGSVDAGTYRYKVVFYDAEGNESPPSAEIGPITTDGSAAQDSIQLANLPSAGGSFEGRRIYRTDATGTGDYQLVAEINDASATTSFEDTVADAALGAVLDDSTLDQGNYSYYVTYYNSANGLESRPTALIGPEAVTVSGRRIELRNIPQPASGEFDSVRLYRSLAGDDSEYYRVATLNGGETSYIDGATDTAIEVAGNELNLDGPAISFGLALVDVVARDGSTYENLFEEGSLTFQARKGGRQLAAKTLEVTAATTVQDLINFMEQAAGIVQDSGDVTNPIVGNPGGTITTDSRLSFVSNAGEDLGLEIGLSSLNLKDVNGTTDSINLGFNATQEGVGETAVTDFVVYDSLGIPMSVRVTVALEQKTSSSTVYRWYADSPDNDPLTGAAIDVGTGTLTFDGEGNLVSTTNTRVSIDRRNVSSASPLEFELDFSQVSGLATDEASVAASRQDGSAAGTLSSFLVGEDGVIRGVFSNGVTRNLGQIQLARFANAAGLEARGENAYAAGVNSGLPIMGGPGQNGIGSVIAGAVELSNSDIGQNLIDLILASTQYRGNTRVINAAQQLLDELLNLRR